MFGLRLMTYLPPDATPAQCEGLLKRWGQAAKGNKGMSGRAVRKKAAAERGEYEKPKRKARLPELKRLRGLGLGAKRIAKELGESVGTVKTWLRKLRGV
jgi:DNA-binding NarL/FixJ family response regulator